MPRYRLRVAVPRIVFGADIFKTQRPDRGYLRDVLAGFRPVEMGRIAGQDDDAPGRIRFEFIGIEAMPLTPPGS